MQQFLAGMPFKNISSRRSFSGKIPDKDKGTLKPWLALRRSGRIHMIERDIYFLELFFLGWHVLLEFFASEGWKFSRYKSCLEERNRTFLAWIYGPKERNKAFTNRNGTCWYQVRVQSTRTVIDNRAWKDDNFLHFALNPEKISDVIIANGSYEIGQSLAFIQFRLQFRGEKWLNDSVHG